MLKENPELEKKKIELVLVLANDKKRMKMIEDDILESLANSDENILDDKKLVQKLESSKRIADEISITMEENKQSQEVINITRQVYNIVAERGALLYFVISDLSVIDPMYQFSLSYFIKLFNQILRTAEESPDQDERILILLNTITETVYLNICRGLFNTHKLIFSFSIASKIFRQNGEIPEGEWSIFLRGVIVDGDIANIENPLPDILNEK